MSDPLDKLTVPTERPERSCVYAALGILAFWLIVGLIVYLLVA